MHTYMYLLYIHVIIVLVSGKLTVLNIPKKSRQGVSIKLLATSSKVRRKEPIKLEKPRVGQGFWTTLTRAVNGKNSTADDKFNNYLISLRGPKFCLFFFFAVAKLSLPVV